VDPTNELAKYLKVNITDKKDTYFKDHPSWYPHGLAQPALIVVDQQGRTLFHWAIVPAEMNLGEFFSCPRLAQTRLAMASRKLQPRI
jgi:hypothetical protein